MNEEFQGAVPKEFNAWVRKSVGLPGSLGKLMENGEAALLWDHDSPRQDLPGTKDSQHGRRESPPEAG
jgi:hypothetical protein